MSNYSIERYFTHKFSNGVVISGTADQINTAAKALGLQSPFDEGVYHYSETKNQYDKISEMNTRYLENVINKRFATWLANNRFLGVNQKMTNFLKNTQTCALIEELLTREDRA